MAEAVIMFHTAVVNLWSYRPKTKVTRPC
jgi:hypothetical protein